MMLFVTVIKVPLTLIWTKFPIFTNYAYGRKTIWLCWLNYSTDPEFAILTTAFNECNYFYITATVTEGTFGLI